MIDSSHIGKRAWSYAGVLQQAGLSCVEYVEQLTMLLFLKMTDQLTEPPHDKSPIVPPALGWKPLLKRDGDALEKQYRESLEKLALKPGMLGVIFKGASRRAGRRDGTLLRLARARVSCLSTKRATPKKTIRSLFARISGPPPATSNSTLCSTCFRSSRSTVVRPWFYRTTCCSSTKKKAVPNPGRQTLGL